MRPTAVSHEKLSACLRGEGSQQAWETFGEKSLSRRTAVWNLLPSPRETGQTVDGLSVNPLPPVHRVLQKCLCSVFHLRFAKTILDRSRGVSTPF